MEKIKTDWVISPLKKVIQLKSGTTIPNELEKSVGQYPFVRVSDFNIPGNEISIISSATYSETFQGVERQLIPVNSIIFPKRGGAIATNKKRITTKEILIDLNTMAAICKPDLDPEFFFFWFKLVDLGDLDGASSSVPQINNDDIYNLLIYHPKEKKEQKVIAAEIKVKLISIEKMLQAALQQKDAIEAMQGSLLKKVFPFQEGEELPIGWKWEKIGNIVERKIEIFTKSERDNFRYIDISAVDNYHKKIMESKQIEIKDAPSRAKYILRTGDIIVSNVRPNLNAVALISNSYNNAIGSSGFTVIRPNENYFSEFIFLFLISPYFIDYVSELVQGAMYPAISDKDIFNCKIPVPKKTIQQQIYSEVNEQISKIHSLKKQTDTQLEAIESLPAAILRGVFEMKNELEQIEK